jgi:hypothetical protein
MKLNKINLFLSIMISVFIQYANDGIGRQVGLELRTYLKDQNFDAFLAGAESPDINYGDPDAWVIIEQKLINSNVIVAICTEGYSAAEGVLRELQIRREKAQHVRILPFRLEGVSIPAEIQGPWRMTFDEGNHSERFCELTLSILKTHFIQTSILIDTLYKNSNANRTLDIYPPGGS